jgi:transcriptional regulator GlxA family with amidase domain
VAFPESEGEPVVPYRVAVFAHDPLSPFHLSVPGAIVQEVTYCGAADWEMRVCALKPGRVRTVDGYDVHVPFGLDELSDSDLVIVPSWVDPTKRAPPKLVDALLEAHHRGAVVAGMCLGAFPLADTGLLDGRRATTHWRATDLFRQRFPAVEVDETVLYVDEGGVVTSAGTAAALDACLHLVRSLLGSAAANAVARGLVVAPHRDGGQAQFIDRPVPGMDRGNPLGEVLEWALNNLVEDLGVEPLAARAHMSRRTFSRAFLAYTGETPATWVRQQRVREAQRLLETTKWSIEKIASSVGFASSVTMRQNFVADVGVTPAAYRRTFGN